jgi:hypothetical protein
MQVTDWKAEALQRNRLNIRYRSEIKALKAKIAALEGSDVYDRLMKAQAALGLRDLKIRKLQAEIKRIRS